MSSCETMYGEGHAAAMARRHLQAMIPAPLRRWREMHYFLKHGEIELHLVPLLCDRNRDAIDVGANEGAYLHVMIANARRVLAFEPIPSLADGLARKFGRRVTVSRIALSRRAGASILRIPMVKGSPVAGLASLSQPCTTEAGACQEITVDTRALDSIFASDAGFIKIDVEGHEEAVLDGAANTIARCRPRLLVELEERFAPGIIHRVHERFQGLGYRGLYVQNGDLHPIETFDPKVLQRAEDIAGYTGAEPRSALAGYVNNFLFLPREDCGGFLLRLAQALARHYRHGAHAAPQRYS